MPADDLDAEVLLAAVIEAVLEVRRASRAWRCLSGYPPSV